MTESYYDYLEIAGTQISGTDLELPKIIHVPRGDQTLTWLSDHSEGQGGWSLELWQDGEEAPFTLPSSRASNSDIKVVSAYGKTELSSEGMSCSISDFDANSMPPSKAYLPVSVDFSDENVEEGIISGVITLKLPEVRMQDIVSSYLVLLADQASIPIEGFSWTTDVDHHGGPSAMVQVHIPSALQVPASAVSMVVHAVNSFGMSTATMSTKLIDVVRSAPVFANFSGDEDPVENQIKGVVTILPAANPKNIIAYTVYLAEGSQKVSVIGRVSATKPGAVRYALHAAFRPGQSLLVVSSYADKDMEHGIVISVQDFVETFSGYGWYGWGGYGESSQARNSAGSSGGNRRLDKGIQEPWLKHARKPGAGDVQPLWSATDSRTLPLPVSNAGRMPLGNRQGIFGTVSIPGLLKPLKLQADDEDHQFVPPSVRERRIIAEVLSESLPGVQHGQVKLTLGRAFKDASALPGVGSNQAATRATPGAASLVVDFEVLAPRLEPQALQRFFDRVEAKLILLSSGGVATARLSFALAKRLEQLGYQFPEQGLSIVVGEPQQVAPKRQPGRLLQEHGVKEGSNNESVQATSAAWTTSAVAFLMSIAGWAAFLAMAVRRARRIQMGGEDGAALESIHVHTVDSATD